MRKQLIIFCLAGAALSGCASAPVDPWAELTVDESPAALAVDCGSFPLPDAVNGDNLVYSNAGANDLEAYRRCSEANAAIVQQHALQIGQLKRSRAALVDAGRSQRNIATMRQEMLEDERKHQFWQSVGYWAVIIGMGLAL